jgi:hypothetical protein
MVPEIVKILVLLALSAGSASLVQAAEPESAKTRAPDTFFTTLGRAHDILSQDVSVLADRIDLFLGGLRTCEDSSGSYIQAGGSAAVHKNGDVLFDHTLNAKVDLPNTRDRFRFVVESHPDKSFREPLSPGARTSTESNTLSQEGSDITKVSSALQFILQEKRKWLISADGGVQMQFPPDPFSRVRLKREFSLGWWRLTGEETVFWFESLGAGESTKIDLEMHLPNCTLLRGTSQAVWKDRDQRFELSQNISLFQELSWKEVLTYKIGITGYANPGVSRKDWGMSVEYRRRIYKNWLYIAVEPALWFSEVNDFQSDPSIRFSFDVFFGEKYAQ